jgi:adenylosuccinate synthase
VSRRKASGPSVSFFAFQDIITSVVGIFVLITLIMMVELVQRKGSTPASTTLLVDSHSSVIADLVLQVEKLESRSKKLDSISTKIGSVQVFNKDEIAKELRASIQSLNEQIERTDQRKREIQRIIDSQTKLQASLQSETVQRSRDREELAKLLKELERLDSKIGEMDSDAPLIFKSKSLDGRTVVVVDVARDETVLLDLDADRRTTIRGKDLEREFKNWIAKHSKGNFHYFLLIRPNGASNFDTLRSSLDESGASYGYDLLDQDRTIRLRSEVIK